MPASQGGRKRPMVPSRHTIMNIQRKMRSITMATYFQSSLTCLEWKTTETVSLIAAAEAFVPVQMFDMGRLECCTSVPSKEHLILTGQRCMFITSLNCNIIKVHLTHVAYNTVCPQSQSIFVQRGRLIVCSRQGEVSHKATNNSDASPILLVMFHNTHAEVSILSPQMIRNVMHTFQSV